MTNPQPLFYKSVVSFDRDVHGAKKLATGPQSFSFSSGTHVIPAVFEEFGAASRHLPIVFLPHETTPTAVFMVGFRQGHNLFVDQNGGWLGRYVPAYLRRYPFIAGEIPGADPVLCFDEASPLLSETEGAPLVTDGKETDLLQEKLTLVRDYLMAAQATEAASRLLKEMDLFQSLNVDFRSAGGASHAVHGIWAVDEAKLNALPDDKLLELRRRGLLGPIYAHLVSLGSMEKLGEIENAAETKAAA